MMQAQQKQIFCKKKKLEFLVFSDYTVSKANCFFFYLITLNEHTNLYIFTSERILHELNRKRSELSSQSYTKRNLIFILAGVNWNIMGYNFQQQ